MGPQYESQAESAAELTRLAGAASDDDGQAASAPLPLVYEQLRGLAEHHLIHESPGPTLQATALVHEAYLRLVGGDNSRVFQGRWHFHAAAAEAMRRILVDHARGRGHSSAAAAAAGAACTSMPWNCRFASRPMSCWRWTSARRWSPSGTRRKRGSSTFGISLA
jgi:hypothetical protein